MVLITKHDKKVWENYISNFEKYAFFPQKDNSKNLNGRNKDIFSKNDKNINRSGYIKKRRVVVAKPPSK